MSGSESASAYRTCEQITRTRAKNFYYGIRLLPPDKRLSLCAVYALARRIDDIGDGEMPPGAKTEALAVIRKSLDNPEHTGDPVLVAVTDAARRFPVPLEAFEELIDGVQSDVDRVTYADFAELTGYCRCVAGSIGRLCLSVFSPSPATDAQSGRYADQLGIALQQTNILRDVREDLIGGRVYLPREDLDRFGVRLELDETGSLNDPDARLAALLRYAAERAENWYALGMRLLPRLDRRSAACARAMAGIYQHLNRSIKSNPIAVYNRRLSLSGSQKARVAVGALAKGAW